MSFKDVMDYYSREDVQRKIIGMGRDREVVGVFRNGSFGSRPNVVIHPNDILSQVRGGAVEFHCSIERWINPMALRTDNYNDLRKGFDIILDLDCKRFEHGRLAAEVVADAIKRHDISNFSVKFSGNRGFHVGIPWESIPRKIDYKESAGQYPEMARKVGYYIRDFVRERLSKRLTRNYSIEELAEQTGKPLSVLFPGDMLDPFQVVDVDPVLISPRHLFRMPYSMHRASGFVSVPVKVQDIPLFEREMARPERVDTSMGYLDSYEEDEASLLIAEAIDWHSKQEVEEAKTLRKRFEFEKAVPVEMFPPCMKSILNGLGDGRKRSIFVLINFLSSLKWEWQDIENLLRDWNKKNSPPLSEQLIRTQLKWHENKEPLPPPNCTQEAWYVNFNVCSPDHICRSREDIKNPLKYPARLMWLKGPEDNKPVKKKASAKRKPKAKMKDNAVGKVGEGG